MPHWMMAMDTLVKSSAVMTCPPASGRADISAPFSLTAVMLTKRRLLREPTGVMGVARATEDSQIGSPLPHHALVQHRAAMLTSGWKGDGAYTQCGCWRR